MMLILAGSCKVDTMMLVLATVLIHKIILCCQDQCHDTNSDNDAGADAMKLAGMPLL